MLDSISLVNIVISFVCSRAIAASEVTLSGIFTHIISLLPIGSQVQSEIREKYDFCILEIHRHSPAFVGFRIIPKGSYCILSYTMCQPCLKIHIFSYLSSGSGSSPGSPYNLMRGAYILSYKPLKPGQCDRLLSTPLCS